MRLNQSKRSLQSVHLTRCAMIGVAFVLLAGLLAACGGSSSSSTATSAAKTSPVASPAGGTPHASPVVSASPTPTPAPPPPAPSPAAVDFANLQMIDEWRSEQVPAYPGSRRLDFKPESQSGVLNAGTMLYETKDSGLKVIAFYRSALPFLGWKELSSNGRQVLMQNDKAAITISVSPKKGGTNIVMQLTDRLGG